MLQNLCRPTSTNLEACSGQKTGPENGTGQKTGQARKRDRSDFGHQWFVQPRGFSSDRQVSYPTQTSFMGGGIPSQYPVVTLCDIGHQGLVHDEAVGLIQNRARVLHARVGRFMQRDPLRYVDGSNLYGAYHMLHRGADPFGLAFVAFDGTGNDANNSDNGFSSPTNVRRLYLVSNDPIRIYKAGVGSSSRPENKTLGGATGLGGEAVLNEAWEELAKEINASGDTDIDIVGFSRGGALALAFANMIHDRAGKAVRVDRKTGKLPWTPICQGVSVRFLGVFDVVGSFGVPGNHINAGKNLTVPSGTKKAVHAMSLNERRATFPVTRLPGAHEVWFAGVHSNIGGGYATNSLSDITLMWMYHHAVGAGVDLNRPDARPSPHGTIRDPQVESVLFALERELVGDAPRIVRPDDMIHVTAYLRGYRDRDYLKWLNSIAPLTVKQNRDPWR